MKTIFFLLAVAGASFAWSGQGIGIGVPAGTKDVTLPIHASDPKAFTRKLANGKTHTWNLDGPNKGTWVDDKGKKIPSSNFVFVAPDTLKIKKVTKEDAGFYDYISKIQIVDTPLPPGVHVDPGMPSGVELSVL